MTPQDTSLSADVIVLDGSVIVNMLKPGVSQTFKEHAHDVFSPYVKSQREGKEFLKLLENKKELFSFLSKEVVTISSPHKQIISTLQETVICRQERDVEGLAPCSHEEADSRMMVHVAVLPRITMTLLYAQWTVMLLCWL